MDSENKFPYCTMELLNSERESALGYVWRYQGLDDFVFVEKAGEMLYWQGYADAMEKAVQVIDHDSRKTGDE